MAEALLIGKADLQSYTALNGNVDTDKFIQFIKIAQDIHIQNYLGTDLLNKIKADIESSTLATPYLELVRDYIKPMLIHWSMVEYLPFSAYQIANKGVYKHSAENSETVQKNEVDFLIEKERNIARHYTERFERYMCFNSATFPEYNTNSNDDVRPDKNQNFSGWYGI